MVKYKNIKYNKVYAVRSIKNIYIIYNTSGC